MKKIIQMRELLKSAFKETPKSFHNAVNNAIVQAIQINKDKHWSTNDKRKPPK